MKIKCFKNMKISKKISLMHSITFVIVQVVICSFIILFIRYYYIFESSKQIENISNQIEKNILLQNKAISNISNKDIIPNIPTKYHININIYDENGHIKNIYGEKKINFKIRGTYGKIKQAKNNNLDIVYCNSCVKKDGKIIAYIQIIVDISQYLDFNTTLFKVLIILTILGCIISLFTGNIVGNVILKPLSKIIETTKEIDSKNLHIRLVHNDTNDELSELSEIINKTLEKLQISFEQQEQLISDVSHELKTPIAVIKGYTNMLKTWGKDDPKVLNESIERMDKEIDNMTNIVSDLLFLARNDKGTLFLDKIKFHMNELIDEIIKNINAINSKIDIKADRNDIFYFYGDFRLIKQMLRIIIDNGIKYSKKQSIIRISSKFENKEAIIEIQDFGIGISDNDINKIFDRFYRADKARTRNKGGTGLGLPIAKAIITAHNGKIKVKSSLGIGTRVIIRLPLKSH